MLVATVYTTVQKFVVSKIFFLKKFIILFIKDELN